MIRRILLTSTSLALVCALTPAVASEPPSPRRILLVTTDTTRADHLSGYGYARATSPVLDALAADGVRVEQAYSTMPTTDPAHLSIFTGLHPRSHGVRKNGVPLPDPSIPNLARWADERGYATGAFVSRAHVTPSALALEGFDREDGPAEAQRDGAVTLERALEWLDGVGDSPVFLWVHFFDPHQPYTPKGEYATRFLPAGAPLPEDAPQPGREHIPAYIARYDGEIAYMDALIGRLLERVRGGAAEHEPPLVVVVGDHGEAMDEILDRHGFAFDHGKYLYDGIVRVPLIFWWGDRLARGAVLDGPTSLVDLPATLFELIGADGFATQGRSLASRIGAGRLPSASAATELPAVTERKQVEAKLAEKLGSEEQHAIRDGRYTLIRSSPGGALELYDRRADPGETRDLAAERPEEAARLAAALDRWLAETPAAAGAEEIPDEKLDALRALGYVE